MSLIRFAFVNLQVDLFNLNKTFPSSKWKNEYAKNIKVMLSVSFRLIYNFFWYNCLSSSIDLLPFK